MADTDFEKRQKMLDLAISQITKEFGKGAIMKLGAEGVIIDIPSISTGCLSLDLATGVGGNAPWTDCGNFWNGVFGENDAGPACVRLRRKKRMALWRLLTQNMP